MPYTIIFHVDFLIGRQMFNCRSAVHNRFKTICMHYYLSFMVVMCFASACFNAGITFHQPNWTIAVTKCLSSYSFTMCQNHFLPFLDFGFFNGIILLIALVMRVHRPEKEELDGFAQQVVYENEQTQMSVSRFVSILTGFAYCTPTSILIGGIFKIVTAENFSFFIFTLNFITVPAVLNCCVKLSHMARLPIIHEIFACFLMIGRKTGFSDLTDSFAALKPEDTTEASLESNDLEPENLDTMTSNSSVCP